jgi:hypothetical protein
LKKTGKDRKENKIKNYFQKSLPEKKQCLLLHPLTEMEAKKQEEHVPRHIELTAVTMQIVTKTKSKEESEDLE